MAFLVTETHAATILR